MTNVPQFALNDGTNMPAVGLGCWMGEPGQADRTYNMVKKSIPVGYRHFDTASGYGNEEAVGRAIRESGLPRNEFYITTKLINHDHGRVSEAFNKSLQALDCEYVDMYLMHWPQASSETDPSKVLPPEQSPTFVETWKDMEKLLSTGKLKSIGVSNFSIKNLEILLPHCSVVPANNQVECHPCLPQHDLKAYCDSKGIILTAWGPLGRPGYGHSGPNFTTEPAFKTIAEKHNVEVAQVVLSWGVQRKTVVVPKTENETRMRTNITLTTLDQSEMEAIDNFHKQPNTHRSLAGHDKPHGMIFGWTYEQMGWPRRNPEGIVIETN
ncbi:Aldo/keto reductase [Dendrothele bispora CBS 962.96]|uniref:Aldo/keto reductase n=1 Tax=Dendrothele bispora (strain CBS 962.96) TaxID=1314807 RepID=A0A4S8L8J7_DENBC|nr:Aldo/keto reductase [Dendrothele bispora CBS 962.96]